jgi:copper chaperone CopZ
MKKTLTLIIAVLMTASFSSVFAADSETAIQTELTQSKKKAALKEVTFKVHLHCDKCVAKVMDNISRAKGVKDLHVCLEDQIVSIKYDSAKTSEDTLKAAIEKLGYKVNGKAEHVHNHAH